MIPGIILAIIRFFFGVKIGALDINVFTLYSSFFESKYFTLIQNNYTDEVAGIFLLLGLFFIAFSKEAVEDENVMFLRLRSLLIAVYIFFSFLLITVLFVFGFAFINVLIADIIIFPAAYIIIFKFNYRKYIIERIDKYS